MKVTDSNKAVKIDEVARHVMQVLGLDEAAKRADVTRRTLERQIALGKGPPIVKLTDWKVGILESDFNDWLLSLRRPSLPKEGGAPVTGNAAKTRKTREALKRSSEQTSAEA
jgi:hypothetical protein